jgi:alcohol dehydrogenase class IV
MEFTWVAVPDKFAKIARAMGEETTNLSPFQAAQKAVEAVRKLCADIQVPKLRDLGVSEEEFQSVVVQMARDGIASGTPSVNPRPVTEKEVVELFKLSF